MCNEINTLESTSPLVGNPSRRGAVSEDLLTSPVVLLLKRSVTDKEFCLSLFSDGAKSAALEKYIINYQTAILHNILIS
jgi:hypothetical protein